MAAEKPFEVRIDASALQAYRGFSAKIQGQLKRRMERLKRDPRPVGSDKLQGSADPVLYRVRNGDFRIIYWVDYHGRIVHVTKIADRRDAY